MVKNVSQLAYTSAPGKGLPLYPHSSSEEESDSQDENKDAEEKVKKEKKKKGKKGKDQGKTDAADAHNLFAEDPSKYSDSFLILFSTDKIDLINNMNSIKML